MDFDGFLAVFYEPERWNEFKNKAKQRGFWEDTPEARAIIMTSFSRVYRLLDDGAIDLDFLFLELEMKKKYFMVWIFTKKLRLLGSFLVPKSRFGQFRELFAEYGDFAKWEEEE